jgi:tRNA-specific 2-thiouridylase
MSGGVDSAVAAALLVREGYQVVGMTMHLHGHAETGAAPAGRACCDTRAYHDARRVCEHIGATHVTVDLREPFRREVLDVFADEYFAGRTPNPCVLCNTRLKWEHLWRRAELAQVDAIATGHYARVETGADGGPVLRRAAHGEKDQSYALWGIPLARLARTLLPLGTLSKAEVRRLARELELPVAEKPESQDICFVPDGDYARFLAHHDPQRAARGGGELVRPDGQVLGRHAGIAHFTLGQRRGLGVASARPLYVSRIEAETGRVHLAEEAGLYHAGLLADGLNWLAEPPAGTWECLAAIRYRDPGSPCQVRVEDGVAEVRFAEPRRAITPGQCVVFYEHDRVLGGGWIRRVLD